MCTKGKRGFLRKAKSVVYTSKAPITIDKHELHSTWPIYNQPEIRHITQDGINLMVERNHTCFGPGDRIAVNVTVKSDSLHTVILRGFEIALKETTLLRSGPHGARGRAQPQSRTVTVAENKVMLNATMYGGQQKQAELSCTLNPKHTTPTLTAARHIDVTYTLLVKAAMGTGDNLFLELPVIISNWQRYVSIHPPRAALTHALTVMFLLLPFNRSVPAQTSPTFQEPQSPLNKHTIKDSTVPHTPATRALGLQLTRPPSLPDVPRWTGTVLPRTKAAKTPEACMAPESPLAA